MATGYFKMSFQKKKVKTLILRTCNIFEKLAFLPPSLHLHISHERAIIDHIKYIILEITLSNNSKAYEVSILLLLW